jgi:hypothetical protein
MLDRDRLCMRTDWWMYLENDVLPGPSDPSCGGRVCKRNTPYCRPVPSVFTGARNLDTDVRIGWRQHS